jgi:hypothetical protein
MVLVLASPEAVALAWAASLPGLSAAMVGDTLPRDTALWATDGFITPSVVGGGTNLYYRLGSPVVGLMCWAVTPDSDVPPWPKARNLAETIRAGTYAPGSRYLALPFCSENAEVKSSYFVGEPRRVRGDFGDYACFTVDVQLHWTPRPK